MVGIVYSHYLNGISRQTRSYKYQEDLKGTEVKRQHTAPVPERWTRVQGSDTHRQLQVNQRRRKYKTCLYLI